MCGGKEALGGDAVCPPTHVYFARQLANRVAV